MIVEDTSLAIGNLMARVERLEGDVAEMRKDQKEVLRILHNAEGSWKTMVAVGGLGTFIGGSIVSLVAFWSQIKGIFK